MRITCLFRWPWKRIICFYFCSLDSDCEYESSPVWTFIPLIWCSETSWWTRGREFKCLREGFHPLAATRIPGGAIFSTTWAFFIKDVWEERLRGSGMIPIRFRQRPNWWEDGNVTALRLDSRRMRKSSVRPERKEKTGGAKGGVGVRGSDRHHRQLILSPLDCSKFS